MLTYGTTGFPNRNAEIDELLDEKITFTRSGKLGTGIEDGSILLNNGSRFRQPARCTRVRAGAFCDLSLGDDKVEEQGRDCGPMVWPKRRDPV